MQSLNLDHPLLPLSMQLFLSKTLNCERHFMELPLDGGGTTLYHDAKTKLTWPSSLGIRIKSEQLTTSRLSKQQGPPWYNGMTDKGKKTTTKDQRVLDNPKSRTQGNCILKKNKIPRYEIRPGSLGNRIQYMKDHVIIAKFIGT